MTKYRSEYPNQVHQLVVSVSKHLYVTKSGILKYQIKPFEIKITNIPEDKKYIVIYALKDHCSGICYVEACEAPERFSVKSFLGRAWMLKESHPFKGIPAYIHYPSTVEAAFPGTKIAIESLGIEIIPVTSGFQTNIGDLKSIDSHFKNLHNESSFKLKGSAESWSSKFSNEPSRVKGQSKRALWEAYVKEIVLPSEQWA